MKNIIKLYAKLVLTTAFLAAVATAQSGGVFSIEQSVIASGGGMSSDTGGVFSLGSTIGQSLATTDPSSGGTFNLRSGFRTPAAFAPTAAGVTVGGRVLTFRGRGIFRAQVSITDAAGTRRTGITNPFGYFRFEDMAAGQTYILSVKAKRFQFGQPTQVLFVTENLTELNFTALP